VKKKLQIEFRIDILATSPVQSFAEVEVDPSDFDATKELVRNVADKMTDNLWDLMKQRGLIPQK